MAFSVGTLVPTVMSLIKVTYLLEVARLLFIEFQIVSDEIRYGLDSEPFITRGETSMVPWKYILEPVKLSFPKWAFMLIQKMS